jgi:diguanylate cyclase (GGDEF)-like protein/PAS domain S-box-containing protein
MKTLAAGKTVVLEHLFEQAGSSPRDFPLHFDEGGRTALGTPLLIRGHAVGSVVLGWRCHVTLTADHIRVVESLAGYAATIIASAQAHEVAEARAAEATASERRYRRILETAQEGIWHADAVGITTYVNQQMADLLGYSVPEMVGLPVVAFLDGEERVLVLEADARRAQAGREGKNVTNHYDLRFLRRDGTEVWTLVKATSVFDEANNFAGSWAMLTDITDRKRIEASLQRSEKRFRALSAHASDLVAILDATGIISYASPSHKRVLGYEPEALEGKHFSKFAHADDMQQIEVLLASVGQPKEGSVDLRTEVRFRHANGTWVTMEIEGVNRLADPAVQGVIVNSRDITERKRMEEALTHQALHDGLTGLPNRALFSDRLDHALRIATRSHARLAVLLVDLNSFNEINDTFGHEKGDNLLQEVAARIWGAVRLSDTVARLGGDEFGAILSDENSVMASAIAERISTTLDQPFDLDGQIVHVGSSIGIAQYPEHGEEAGTLLQHAEVAMYVAKRSHSRHTVYEPNQDAHMHERLALIAELQQGIAEGELLLFYQPKVEVGTRRLVGVEALVRWQNKRRGLMQPDQFIPLAEQTGLIGALTRWVLEEAIRQASEWRKDGLDLSVAVNLAASDLRDAALPDLVAALLEAHALPPASLRLEVTESTLITDAELCLGCLSRLAQLGVGVSIDDYGTGYSSLTYLKELPVDELKIDRSFVRQMARSPADVAIVQSTIGLGHSLGLHVVAEGVEDSDSWNLLTSMNCDVVQGYYLCKPVPREVMSQWQYHKVWPVEHVEP